jgi:hypothetical protein
MRILAAIALAGLCAGCVTAETVQFRAAADQRAITRDGNPAIVSTKKNSIVMIRPASRQFQTGGRPVFVLAIFNRTGAPQDFRVANVKVAQVVNGESVPIKVVTYEMLVQEERNRQIAMAIIGGMAVAANSYSASRAGYYNSTSTVYTPRGSFLFNTTGYSPGLAAAAQANASAQNAAMTAAIIDQGQRNLATLERGVIKDNTLMPGEWIGGQLHLSPLVSDSAAKNYTITVLVGKERHDISVIQGTPSETS